jgi:anti-sigma B factor antagonist
VILNLTKKTLQPGVVSLEIKGSMHTGPDCMRLMKEIDGFIAAKETRVIFDLGTLTHADSAAIGAMVRCLSNLKKAGGALRIAAAHPMIVHSLHLTKVDKLVEMFPTVESAAADFPLPGTSPAKPS